MFLSYAFVFFQAEDGIRDLVRSRGLGDVYKRQSIEGETGFAAAESRVTLSPLPPRVTIQFSPTAGTVSYTHLTLPTSDLV